jgi:5-formyltetrahydrofolate cyclo-ligase
LAQNGAVVDGSGIEDAKRQLRARMRAVRAAIAADADVRRTRSQAICEQVIAELGTQPPARMMVYTALPTEPDVSGVAEWSAANGIEVYTPAVAGDALLVMPDELDPSLLDAVVVPGLAYTRDGRRLGQGGGHFDRFLPRLRDGCRTIGVVFREQLVDDVPTDGHDATVDVVVTG